MATTTVALLLLAACASAPKVRVDKDANVDFGDYKTFAWYVPPKEQPKTEAKSPESSDDKQAPAPKVNSLIDNRVHAALATALQAKGYTLDESNPDFRVNYVLNVVERPKDSGMRIGLGAGGGSGNVGGGVGLSIPIGKRTNTVGAMTIDMIDSKRSAQVWTGFYEDMLKAEGVGDADAQNLVNTILEKFPKRE